MKSIKLTNPSHIEAQIQVLDALKTQLEIVSDADLARRLGEDVVTISRYRRGTHAFGAAFAIRLIDRQVIDLPGLRQALPEDHPFNAKARR